MDSFKNLLGGGDKKDDKKEDKDNEVSDEHAPLKGQLPTSFADSMNVIKQQVNKRVDDAAADVTSRVDSVRQEVNTAVSKMDDAVKKILKEYQFKINKWARNKVQEALLKFLDQMRPKIKEAAKDPDMCNSVKHLIDDIVDDVWPEIMEEVKFQLMIGVSDPFVEVGSSKTIVCLIPCYKIRNWYLYSVDPFDRTIWKRFKTISWWFWTIVSAIPFYGISQFFYAFDFLMRSKEDEFQLVQFILRFKTMYFFTQGVLKAIIGYFMLYSCTTMDGGNPKTQQDSCSKIGPGASLQEMSEIIGFFVQLFFIWLAFFLLPMSKQLGRPRFIYEDERGTLNS